MQADAGTAGRGPGRGGARAAYDVQQAVMPVFRREVRGTVLRRVPAPVGRDPGLCSIPSQFMSANSFRPTLV